VDKVPFYGNYPPAFIDAASAYVSNDEQKMQIIE
jgi:hypothetical protein